MLLVLLVHHVIGVVKNVILSKDISLAKEIIRMQFQVNILHQQEITRL
jgi:hypothetical protein